MWDSILNTINQTKYDFLGPIVFTVIMLIGISIGFLNGYKTASFFLILNVISIIATILIFNFSKEISNIFFSKNSMIGNWKIQDLINDGFIETVKNLGGETQGVPLDLVRKNAGAPGIIDIIASISSLIIYAGLNIFIFIPIYLFIFRKKLKKSMFQNQSMGSSNISHRLGGAVFGFFTISPIALIVGSVIASFGNSDSSFVWFISSITNIVFIGKIGNITESIKNLAEVKEFL